MRPLVIATASALLAACAVGPDYRAAVPEPVQLHNAGAPGVFVADSPVAGWWRQFDDPVLDRLVGDALAANPDLRIAVTRVRAARAVFVDRRLDPWPHVTAGADQLRTGRSLDGTDARVITEDYSLGFDAAWELDLFGRLRRGAEAARADLEAEQAGLEDAQVSIAAEVARNYFVLRGAQKRIAVADRTLSNLRETQRLTEVRRDLGAGSELDVQSSQARIKAIEADIPLLETAAARARHRLAVLLGLRPWRARYAAAAAGNTGLCEGVAAGRYPRTATPAAGRAHRRASPWPRPPHASAWPPPSCSRGSASAASPVSSPAISAGWSAAATRHGR